MARIRTAACDAIASMTGKFKTPKNLLINIRDWLEQTAILPPAERWAFLALKMHYWRSGQIPDKDTALARIVGMESKDWKNAREALEPMFIVRGGEWFRTDWNEELEAAYAAVRKASANGRNAARSRWDKEKGSRKAYEVHTPSIASGMRDECVANAPSVLKYTKANPPSQGSDVFTDGQLESAVANLEGEWGASHV